MAEATHTQDDMDTNATPFERAVQRVATNGKAVELLRARCNKLRTAIAEGESAQAAAQQRVATNEVNHELVAAADHARTLLLRDEIEKRLTEIREALATLQHVLDWTQQQGYLAAIDAARLTLSFPHHFTPETRQTMLIKLCTVAVQFMNTVLHASLVCVIGIDDDMRVIKVRYASFKMRKMWTIDTYGNVDSEAAGEAVQNFNMLTTPVELWEPKAMIVLEFPPELRDPPRAVAK